MKLQQAAQQALEALEEMWQSDKAQVAITALREALAEPGSDYERGFVDGLSEQAKRSVDKAANRMADPEQKSWFTVEELNEFATKLKEKAWKA